MYSSIYRVQSSTRRLPIRALFGFTLKLVESYLSFSSESLCGGLSLVPTLGRLTVPQVVSIQAHHCCTTMMFDLPTILLPTAVYQVLSAARIFREHDLLHSPADCSTISHDKLICKYLHMYTEVSSLSYSQTHVASQESTAQ